MQQMTLNRPTERERGLFMITIDSYFCQSTQPWNVQASTSRPAKH